MDEQSVPAISGTARQSAFFAHLCHSFYLDGLDIMRKRGLPKQWNPWEHKGVTYAHLHQAATQLDDNRLRELLHALGKSARALDRLNDQWAVALSGFVGLPIPETRADFRAVSQKVDRLRRARGSIWTADPEMAKLVAQTGELAADIDQRVREVEERLSLLFPSTMSALTEDTFDERVEDLIDRASDETDARRAINLLHRALRYGRTGVQASTAFTSLARRYEDLGNATRAISYYTEALQAWRPTALTLFWRGSLYYRLGLRDEARRDLEQAVAFPAGQRLDYPELDEAQKYLAELQQ